MERGQSVSEARRTEGLDVRSHPTAEDRVGHYLACDWGKQDAVAEMTGCDPDVFPAGHEGVCASAKLAQGSHRISLSIPDSLDSCADECQTIFPRHQVSILAPND